MSDQEIVATAETQVETSTLFDELAGLVPEERLTEYYRVIAHTRTLSPNDEMLRILEAMGVLALLTREIAPCSIAKGIRNRLGPTQNCKAVGRKSAAVLPTVRHTSHMLSSFAILR
jgi:hypothetical protein